MRVLTAVLLMCAVILLNGCSSVGRDELITIGVLLPLTGDLAEEGLRALNGVHLAKQEINRNGGISGKKIDLVVLNDKGCAEHIVTQYEELKRRGAVAVIGSVYSYTTIPLAEASAKDGTPIISPTASHPDVTQGRDNVFRAIFIDEYQARAMARFAYDDLGARTALVLFSSAPDGFGDLSDAFAAIFNDYDGASVMSEYYQTSDDFVEILMKYRTNRPDIIYAPESFAQAAYLVNAAYDLGFEDAHILGSDSWNGLAAYVRPEAAKNIYYTTSFVYDDYSPDVLKFVTDYMAAFAQKPLTSSAAAYTALNILAEAIQSAGSVEPSAIVAAMKTNGFNAVTGEINFDADNNPLLKVYILQLKDGVYSTRAVIYND